MWVSELCYLQTRGHVTLADDTWRTCFDEQIRGMRDNPTELSCTYVSGFKVPDEFLSLVVPASSPFL